MNEQLKKIVTKAEQVTKTDVRYLTKSSFWLTLNQITSALFSIGLTTAFANLIPIATYGVYRYILSVYNLVAMFGLPGMDTAILQSVSKGFDNSFKRGFWLKFKWSHLGMLASFIFAAYNQIFTHNFTVAIAMVIVGLCLPLSEATGSYVSLLHGKKLFRTSSIMAIILQFTSTAGLITALLLTKEVLIIIAIYFVVNIITNGAFVLYSLRRHINNQQTDPHLLSYGKSLTIFNVISRIIASIDQIVLFNILGPVQVALFALASAVPNRIQSLLRIAGTVAFPKLAQRPLNTISKTLPRKCLLFGLLIIGLIIFYIVLAPFVFTLLFPRYLPALQYSQFLVIYNLGAITYPISSALFAHKHVKENYAIATTNLIVKIIALIALVPLVGIWGAVVSTVLAAFSTIGLSFYFLKKAGHNNPSSTNNDTSSTDPTAAVTTE